MYASLQADNQEVKLMSKTEHTHRTTFAKARRCARGMLLQFSHFKRSTHARAQRFGHDSCSGPKVRRWSSSRHSAEPPRPITDQAAQIKDFGVWIRGQVRRTPPLRKVTSVVSVTCAGHLLRSPPPPLPRAMGFHQSCLPVQKTAPVQY